MLIKALARRRKNIELVGIEACPLSEWLYGALVDSGFTRMCIGDADVVLDRHLGIGGDAGFRPGRLRCATTFAAG